MIWKYKDSICEENSYLYRVVGEWGINWKELNLHEQIFLEFESSKAHLDVKVIFKHNLVLDDPVGILWSGILASLWKALWHSI